MDPFISLGIFENQETKFSQRSFSVKIRDSLKNVVKILSYPMFQRRYNKKLKINKYWFMTGKEIRKTKTSGGKCKRKENMNN